MFTAPTPRRRLLLGALTSLLALILAALYAPSCADADRPSMALAQRITSNAQLIGGPAARGEIGDYLLENDKIRVVVQDLNYNRGSGLFGGSLIDADLVRAEQANTLLGANGRDSFGELFPAFFLEVVDPEEIEVLNDGTDGKAAVIEVRGRGGEFVSQLRVFNQIMVNSYDVQKNITRALQNQPPLQDQDPLVRFRVRYILEPGAQHVRIESTLENISQTRLKFPNQGVLDLLAQLTGIELGNFTVPTGHVIGLGKLNTPFLPGIGFDLQFGLERAYKNTPIALPALPGHLTPIVASSSGNGVSYGFTIKSESEAFARQNHFAYAKDQEPNPQTNAPLYGGKAAQDDMLFLFYASGFGGVFTHQLPPELAPQFCGTKDNDPGPEQACADLIAQTCTENCEPALASCQKNYPGCRTAATEGIPTSYTFTSYLLVGAGDVSSLWDEAYKIKGVKASRVVGQMINGFSAQPEGQGRSLLIYQARPTDDPEATGCTEGAEGAKPFLYNQVDTLAQGRFEFTLPPGHYCYRTRAPGHALGPYNHFQVLAGQDRFLAPTLLAPGHLLISTLDESGRPIPAKVSVVGTHPYVQGATRPDAFLFDLPAGEPWRATDMVADEAGREETRRYVEQIEYTGAQGQANFPVRPNRQGDSYTVYISRGPEYDVVAKEIVVRPGETARFTGTLVRAVDTTGYISGDFHLHARGSIDSGLDYNERVLSIAAEGLELGVTTEHNYVADYEPYILSNRLEEWVASMIGLELTTFEAGHFNGFPLRYDVELANRGSFEWQEQPPGLLFEELRQRGSLGPADTIVQVNHPRDSILGYFSQHNVDALDATVTLPFKEMDASIVDAVIASNGPAFYTVEPGSRTLSSTFSWNFDAIEVFNGKRQELLRHFRLSKSQLRPVYLETFKTQRLEQDASYDPDDCQAARTALVANDCDPCDELQQRVNQCTQLEVAAETGAQTDADDALAKLGDAPVIVCEDNDVAHPGHLDDWYNMLNTNRPDPVKPYERQALAGDPDRLARYENPYKRYVATGNSDSHGARGLDEPGYPRNFVFVGNDDPSTLSPRDVVKGFQDRHVVVSNGPFVTMTVNGAPIGSEIQASGSVSVALKVQVPNWLSVNRWQLIANGEVLRQGPIQMESGNNTWSTTLEVDLPQDAWLVTEITGDANMFPVLTPNEIPPFDIGSAIGSLAEPFGFGVTNPLLSPALTGPVTPFAFTNPIWVIRDGDGTFTPPGTSAARCTNGIASPAGALSASAAVALPPRLRSKRLDALNLPDGLHAHPPKPLDARLKGDKRDVRIIFESWGHSH